MLCANLAIINVTADSIFCYFALQILISDNEQI